MDRATDFLIARSAVRLRQPQHSSWPYDLDFMEHAAFESPLSDEHLKELGRLVINCGFVEFLLNFHVAVILEIGTSSAARTHLVTPLNMRRELEVLKARRTEIPKLETRTLVDEVCKIVDFRSKNATFCFMVFEILRR